MDHKKTKIEVKDLFWIIYLWIMGFVILSGIIFNFNRALAKSVLVVRSSAVVSGEKITLGDIAGTSDPSIKNIVIGKSPDPSKTFSLSGYKVAAILRSRKLPADLSIELPETILVKRDFQRIKITTVENFFRSELDRKLKKGSYRLKRLKVRGLKNYAKGKIDLKTNLNSNDLKGHTVQKIQVFVDGVQQGDASVIVWIDRFVKGAVLTVNLSRNSIIKSSDVKLGKINISKHRGDYISDLSSVIGKKVKRTLHYGSILSKNTVERAPLITKGSVVRLVAKRGNLVVETIGKAKNDGFKGETILVENISSKKTVAGKVLNKTTVSAFF